MQQPSSSTVLRGSLAAGLLRKTSRLRGVIQLTFALGLSLLAALIFATPACGQAYSSTNYWTGLAGSPDWPMAANWSNHIAPTATSFVVLTNYGATGFPAYGMGAIGTPNIVINEDTTVGSLWIVNTNLTGDDAGFHTIQLNNGATLTLSNNASFDGGNVTNILQVCSQAGHTGQWGVQNGLANQAIYGTIQGEGASLVVICTNGLTGIPYQRGNIFVSQGALGLSAAPTEDPCNAILDLSGLDRFVAHVNHICVAADPGSTPFYFHRAAGTLYLAKTNELTLWAQGNAPSGAAINQGLLAGMIALNNGSPLTRVGRVYLGLTNAIFCDTGLGVGIRNSSGWLGFNPLNLPGDSAAFFRDRAGTGRQNMWAVGNRLGVTATGGSDTKGELDFTAGTVDALVNQLQIGKSASNLKTYGVVSLSAGVLDVNTLQLGYQTTAGNAEAQGTLNVNNTAVVKINTSAVLGYLAGNPVSGHEYFGRLNIADGGTVELGSAAPLTCGVGGSRSEIRVVNGSSLKAHHMGAPGAPLTYLQLAGSTLTLDQGALPNPTAPMCSVTTLETTGPVTINVYGTTLLAGTITLIKYDTWNGNFSDLVLGSTPNITGYLTHNVANASIDLVITEGSARALKWNGRAQGVDTGDWDIGVTAAWQGDLVYQQAGVVGDQVEFDDTAAGTTRVVLADDQLAPLLVLVDNQTKNYEFTGAGALTGSGGLTKKGSGTLTLANTGDNTFGGPVNLEGGVLRQDGLADRLPTNAVVTLANAGGVTLDLNGFDLQLGSLSGGGAVNLGAGNLSLGAGGGNFAGVISGSGALIKNTAGTQTLSGANTYSGGTVVANSSLVVTNSTGSGLGSGPVTIGPGGILQLGNGVVEGHIDATEIYNDGRLNLFPATDQTFTKTVTGAGVLAKMLGNGTTLVFNHANDYAGGTIIYQGTVLAAHPEALGTGPITVGNWTATDTMLAVSGDITLTNAIVLSGKTGALVPSPVGVNNVFDPTTYQAGTNTLSGPITLAGATCWAVGSDAGLLIVNGGLVNNQNGPLCQFFLRGSAEGVWNSALKDASTANRLMLEKTDAGTWTVASTNTFTGRTLVSDGKLILTGALNGSSNVVVKSGATLAGTGWITGAVTNSGTIDLSDDDVLRPLTVNGVYLMDYLATVKLSVGPEGNDSIGGMPLCVLDGILEVVLEGPLTGNAVFKLFDAAAYEGAFAGYDLPDISPLSWDTSSLAVDGTLRVTGGARWVPEISHVSYTEAGGLVLSGSGPLVGNFIVLASDDVAAPLADWTEVGQGTFSNGTFTFTDPTATNAPQRFYRVLLGADIGPAEPAFQTRAIWATPPSFATAAAADELITRCQRAGLNLILPDVMVHQTIYFRSTHFPGRVAANDRFDPLAYLARKCRAAGIKLQPWCCVYYEGAGSAASLHPDWTVRSLVGQPFSQNFLAPGHPEVNPYLLAVLQDLLAYDIDGIHLDYIRYPGSAFDYATAACQAFQAEKGFDPRNFLDHPERLVPPAEEPFPVRVLQPEIHAGKVWETTAIERTLDQAGFGHAFIAESPENIERLRAPGLLVISSYYDVPEAMVAALADFVTRGGTILWTDVPTPALAQWPALRQLVGIQSARWIGKSRITLTAAGNHPLGNLLRGQPFTSDTLYGIQPQGAQVIATLADGTPGVVLNAVGQGRVITLAFHLMKSTSPEVARIARQILAWCETEAGVTAPNPLAAKRAEWIAWRADRVTALVRDLGVAAKAKDPRLVISSSGGPSPWEFYACYRDARRWLAEGLNDEVFPMNYTPDPEELVEILQGQTAAAPPGTLARIHPGLQLYVSETVGGGQIVVPQNAAVVARQLQVVQQQGYRGFCLFADNYLTEEIIAAVRPFSEPVK